MTDRIVIADRFMPGSHEPLTVSVAPSPFALDVSHRNETAPSFTLVKPPKRKPSPEPLFLRELRRAVEAAQ